jgi:DNA-binding SARP family transcriptional activator
MLKLYLFGPPRLERNGHPIEISLRKALALFVYLAVTKQTHSRDALSTLFWPEKDQQTARANLRRALFDLGQPLGDALLEVTPEMVRLRSDAGLWVDVDAFQRALAGPAPPPSPGAPLAPTAKADLVTAVDHYSNDFLAGFTLRDAPDFDDWQFFQREELRSTFAGALQQLIQIAEDEANWEEALRYARRWLLLDPLEESVQRRLMALYAQAGQPAAALRQYEECVRILQAELDAPPAAETDALYAAIRTKRFPTTGKLPHQHSDGPTPLAAVKPPTADHAVTPSPPHPPPHPSTTIFRCRPPPSSVASRNWTRCSSAWPTRPAAC